MTHALVIAAGNPDRGDDGAGPAVAELLREAGLGAELLAPRVLPPDLHGSWSPESRVVIVDAVRSGAAPGTVHRLDARDAPLPAELQSLSTHGVGLARAVELARVLDALPAELTVFGIEAGPCELGDPLSPEVAEAVREVAAAVRRELESASASVPAAAAAAVPAPAPAPAPVPVPVPSTARAGINPAPTFEGSSASASESEAASGSGSESCSESVSASESASESE